MSTILNNIKSDMAAALAARKQGNHLIFGYLGMPGIGKTQMIQQAAADLGLEFFGDMVLSSCSPMDIMGKVPNMEDEVLASLPNDDIPLDYRVGDTAGVWFVDEVTNATSDTLKALQQGLLSRKFGKHELGKNVIVVLAGNRQTDKAGSGVLSTAVYNRVTWRNLDWTAKESDAAVSYIADKYASDEPKAVETLALLQGYFAHKPISEGDFTSALGRIGKEPFVQWCSPRSLEAMVSRISVTGWGLPGIEDMAGDIGLGRATELAGFAKLLGKLPKFEEVVSNPKEARLPDAADAQYAMAAMLAVRTKKGDFAEVWDYVARIKEATIRVVFLRMAMKASPEVRETRAYADIYKTDVELAKMLASL